MIYPLYLSPLIIFLDHFIIFQNSRIHCNFKKVITTVLCTIKETVLAKRFNILNSSNRQIWPWSTEWTRAKVNRVLPRECTGHSKYPFPTKQDSTHGHHQIVNTEIRLITFFAAKDAEALYSQQKQDREPTVAQIMNSLLPKSGLNWRKWGKSLDHSGMT